MRRFLLVLCFYSCSAMDTDKKKKTAISMIIDQRKTSVFQQEEERKNAISTIHEENLTSPVISIIQKETDPKIKNRLLIQDVVKRLMKLSAENKNFAKTAQENILKRQEVTKNVDMQMETVQDVRKEIEYTEKIISTLLMFMQNKEFADEVPLQTKKDILRYIQNKQLAEMENEKIEKIINNTVPKNKKEDEPKFVLTEQAVQHIFDSLEETPSEDCIVPGYLTPHDSSKSNPSSYNSNKSHISPTNSNKDMNDQVMNGGELKKTILTFDANQQQIQEGVITLIEPDNQSQHVMVRVIEHAQNDQNPETIRASFSLSRYLSSCFCFFWCAPYTT